MGSFLEYLYKGEYFPKRIGEGRDGPLEIDPSVPAIDNTGDQLLKHARIYTLADKLYMPVSITSKSAPPSANRIDCTNTSQGPQITGPQQDPPHHLHRPRRNRVRALRLRLLRRRRHHLAQARRGILGHALPRLASRSRRRVQGHVSGVSAIRFRSA